MLAADLMPLLAQRGHEVVPADIAPPQPGHEAFSAPPVKLDMTDLEAVRAAAESIAPGLIVNCAAYNRVDQAESEEEQALMVNGLGVQNLCLVCQERGIPLVHFSSDYVFDGSKDGPYTIGDQPNPLGAYGRSKLQGEKYVLWLLHKFYLVRTTWLFGACGPNFVDTMLEIGQKRDKVSVVNDQRGCPTWTRDLAEAVVDLIETGRYGIYHVTNSEPTTWFGLAQEVFRLAGMDIEVSPVGSEEFPRPARRPLNSVLDPFPLPQLLGREMPSWRDGLREHLRQQNRLVAA
jgi:dTDP-4-dehydrorhamnose reductase